MKKNGDGQKQNEKRLNKICRIYKFQFNARIIFPFIFDSLFRSMWKHLNTFDQNRSQNTKKSKRNDKINSNEQKHLRRNKFLFCFYLSKITSTCHSMIANIDASNKNETKKTETKISFYSLIIFFFFSFYCFAFIVSYNRNNFFR